MTTPSSLAPPFPICVCIRKLNDRHFSVYPMRDTFYKREDFPENVRCHLKWAKCCRHASEAKAEAEAMVAWLKTYGINSTILRVEQPQ